MEAGSKGIAFRERADDFSACVWGGGDDFLRATDPFPVLEPAPAPRVAWFRGRDDIGAAAARATGGAEVGGGSDDAAGGAAARAEYECECECECGCECGCECEWDCEWWCEKSGPGPG